MACSLQSEFNDFSFESYIQIIVNSSVRFKEATFYITENAIEKSAMTNGERRGMQPKHKLYRSVEKIRQSLGHLVASIARSDVQTTRCSPSSLFVPHLINKRSGKFCFPSPLRQVVKVSECSARDFEFKESRRSC